MRFKYNKVEPCNGNTRIKKKFTWLPVFINGKSRWLEFVTVEQTYKHDYVNYEEPNWACWYNTKFIN